MNSSIKIALVAAVAVAGMTACTSAPAPKNNAAPQTTSSTSSTPTSETSSPPAVVTEVVTQTVTNAPEPQAVVNVDSRLGYGALKLGMTLEEARATGLTNLTWESDGDGTCVADDKVTISKKYGVSRIVLPKDARTSKGIGVGSTFADVKKAYPSASEYRSGWSASLSDKGGYAFLGASANEHFGDADKVVLVKLTSYDTDCAMALL